MSEWSDGRETGRTQTSQDVHLETPGGSRASGERAVNNNTEDKVGSRGPDRYSEVYPEQYLFVLLSECSDALVAAE